MRIREGSVDGFGFDSALRPRCVTSRAVKIRNLAGKLRASTDVEGVPVVHDQADCWVPEENELSKKTGLQSKQGQPEPASLLRDKFLLQLTKRGLKRPGHSSWGKNSANKRAKAARF